MSNPNTRKSCVVPKCTNTTTNAPDKLFFIVPKDIQMRKNWIKAMKRLDPFGDKSTVYCCEDHFDIKNDMENYIKYKMVGGRIKLKKGIVPHKFKCQQEKEGKPERSAVQKRNQINFFEKRNEDETSALEKPEEIFVACCEDEIVIEDPINVGNSNQCTVELADPVVKLEPGDERFSASNVKTEITFPQLSVEFEARTEGEQNAGFENVCVKVESDLGAAHLAAAKPEPGSAAGSGDGGAGGDGLYSDVDTSLPDVKQECSEHSRKADQRTGLSTLLDSTLEETGFPTPKGETTLKAKISKSLALTLRSEKLFSCSQCAYVCKQKGSLRIHMRTHTGEKLFSCSECAYSSNRKDSLTMHTLTHGKKKPFLCTQCTYSCYRKGSLKIHMISHTGEKLFSCLQCTYTCNQRGSLRVHTLTHTGERLFSCPQCCFSCNRIDSLSRHILTHSRKKPFSCSQCSYSCNRKGNLRVHMLTHTKLFSCSQCTYSCNQKDVLIKHVHTHNRQKPFSCSQCTYSSVRKGNLKLHMLTHTGKKLFSCSQCTYSCNNKGSLRVHMLTHTGEKPFSCSQCTYSCNRRGHLRVHMLTHSNDKTLSP